MEFYRCCLFVTFSQTGSNAIKQGVQTRKSLITKQCLIISDHQTSPIWTELYNACLTKSLTSLKFYLTRSNAYHPARSNKVFKMFGYYSTQCLIVFGRRAVRSGWCGTRSAGSQYGWKLISSSPRQNWSPDKRRALANKSAEPCEQSSNWVFHRSRLK